MSNEFPYADYDRWKTTEPDYDIREDADKYEGDEEADEYENFNEDFDDYVDEFEDEPYAEDYRDDFNDGEFW